MGELRDQFVRHMGLRGFSKSTVTGYVHAIVELATAYGRSPDTLSNEEIQEHLWYLIKERKLAWSTINVRFSAYRSFFYDMLGWDKTQFRIPARKRSKKQVTVLTRQEVEAIIDAPSDFKHRAMLTMVYGSGLRASEVPALTARHIESARDRMMVLVENGKGNKDRYTILSKRALKVLREYWKAYRPAEGGWLFPGRKKGRAVCTGTVQRAYKKAAAKAGVSKKGGIHLLRHAFATHLLDEGVSVYAIKRLLGHASLSTTAGYLHVTAAHVRNIDSPLDVIREGLGG